MAHQGNSMLEASVTSATAMHKMANVERLAGYAMVGSDDLVNAALPPPADGPAQVRGAEGRALVVRSGQVAQTSATDKSLWAWGTGWFAGRATA